MGKILYQLSIIVIVFIIIIIITVIYIVLSQIINRIMFLLNSVHRRKYHECCISLPDKNYHFCLTITSPHHSLLSQHAIKHHSTHCEKCFHVKLNGNCARFIIIRLLLQYAIKHHSAHRLKCFHVKQSRAFIIIRQMWKVFWIKPSI